MQQGTIEFDANQSVISVGDLTRCIRAVIEAEDLFADVWVRGEISNFVKHASGHIYFSLKDETAVIRCVVWANSTRSIRFNPTNGMRVIARGRVSVYEKQGQYQLVASELIPDGIGDLYVAYEQLKAQLQAEGLFDVARKKTLPAFPRRIAIVTSRTAAALRDMVTVAGRRMPSVELILVPALMQGEGSESSVAASLALADDTHGVDVIVLGRGGGSIEDLWTFNSESVVRAICACRTPVVSAIGHETDFTLSDLAADLRAPTPSAAMEIIVPDREELRMRLASLCDAMTASMRSAISQKDGLLARLMSSPSFKFPERMLQGRWQSLDLLQERTERAFRQMISHGERRLGEISAYLHSLSPLAVLGRGYAVVRSAADGHVIGSIGEISAGQATETLVSDGVLISEVIDVKEGWDKVGQAS
jgi:exodeoxyribonuclease VII large subunit